VSIAMLTNFLIESSLLASSLLNITPKTKGDFRTTDYLHNGPWWRC
jgi:hypothetical protein